VDCTLGLLNRSLPRSNQSYAIVEDTKPPQQPLIPHPFQISFPIPLQSLTYNGNTVANGNSSSSTYIPAGARVAHQQISCPITTQYSAYPESATNSSNLASMSHDSVSSYSADTNSVKAPLLTAFATPASQVSPVWRPGSGSALLNSGPQAGHQWTAAMAGNTGNTGQLEPHGCYSANALMQFCGPDMSNGTADNLQFQLNVVNLHDPVNSTGVEWPMNVVGMGHGS
jgi:hypothetical protein